MNENQKRHLEHTFYKNSTAFRADVKKGQILKGADKYPEPFTPTSWTPLRLLIHAMEENVDQEHYIYGLYELLQAEQEERADRIDILDSALRGISYLVHKLKEDNVLYHTAKGVELILESLYDLDQQRHQQTKEDSI